ncbi:MAG: hypothetical protein AAFR59_20150 [Bacteroidota bacterium]
MLLIFLSSQAQEAPFIRSFELEYQKAVFDPSRGIALRANHAWKEKEKSTLQTGLMLTGLLAPGSSPTTTGTLSEFNSRLRLQAHTGYERQLLGSRKFYGIAEIFVGLRMGLITGSLDQGSQNFNRDFSAATLQWDAGTRLGLGYHLGETWGIQLTLNNSWRQINNPLGLPPGLFFWGPDVLALVGVGVNYRL